MFDELDGIAKARDIKGQEKSILEILLDNSRDMVEKYKDTIKSIPEHEYKKIRSAIYSPVYWSIKTSLPEFTEQNIQGFLHAAGNNNGYEWYEKKILGIYSGILLHVLTERNEEQGKGTIMHVRDTHFDYLFTHIRKADTIVLENCTGEAILEYAASFHSLINTIVVQNCEGNNLLRLAAKNYGSIGRIFIDNHKSDILLDHPAFNGTIYTIVISNIEAMSILNNSAIGEGQISTVILSDVKANDLLDSLGKVINVIASNITVDSLIENKPYPYWRSKTFLANNVITKNPIDGILIGDGTPESFFFKKEIKYSLDNPSNQPEISRILNLVSQIKGKSAEELLPIVKQIEEVYVDMEKER